MIFMSCANAQENKYLGGLTPENALSIMIAHPDVFIIDVREDEWYNGFEQFEGNHHIPNSQISKRLDEIPTDCIVILNCGFGWVAPESYRKIKDSKIKVKQLGYIEGTPLFEDYNNWKKSHR